MILDQKNSQVMNHLNGLVGSMKLKNIKKRVILKHFLAYHAQALLERYQILLT
tara:strand:+ start:151 stop:309 length:159 start_codon:yes stop_codon:yes gene_type:complete